MYVCIYENMDVSLSNLHPLCVAGKNDPFLIIKMGEFEAQTHVLENAGSRCEWDMTYEPIKIIASDAMISNVAMDVKCFDHNDVLSSKLIGEAVLSLKSILSDAHGKEIPLDFQIIDKHGKVSGYITIYVTYMKMVKTQCDPLCGINAAVACKTSLDFVADFILNLIDFVRGTEPESAEEIENNLGSRQTFAFKHARFAVKRIEVKNASAVEIMGKNDLFCNIQCAELDLRTETRYDIGPAAVWDLTKDNICNISSHEISTAKARVEVYDENSMLSNTLIGSEEISIRSLFDHVGVAQKFSFTAFCPQKKRSAEVILTMEVLN